MRLKQTPTIWVTSIVFFIALLGGTPWVPAALAQEGVDPKASTWSVIAGENADEAFQKWLEDVYQEGVGLGISSETLQKALTGLTPDPEVLRLDQHQPEFKQTLEQYMEKRVGPNVSKGRTKIKEHGVDLRAIAAHYQVPSEIIVALWGIETNYGGYKGDKSIVRSLATLAYEGRRQAFFRGELLHALEILDAGHVDHDRFHGSWAGAMGHCQFMPSSFKAFAQDWDGDGRADIWHAELDAWASIANYLHRSGWNQYELWGRPVTLPANFDKSLAAHKTRRTLKEWQKLGVRTIDGKDLPKREIKARVVLPKSSENQAFLVYPNYDVILKWNRSDLFAISVGVLSDQLGMEE